MTHHLKMLCVDDDEDMRKCLVQQFTEEDFIVDDADDGEDGGQQLSEVLLQRRADRVHVVHRAAQQLAPRFRIVEPERQPFELRVHLAADRVDRVLRDSGHQVLLQVLEDGADDI